MTVVTLYTSWYILYIFNIYYILLIKLFFYLKVGTPFGGPLSSIPPLSPLISIFDCYIKLLKFDSMSFDNNHQITFHLLFASRPVFRILIISTTFTHPSVSNRNIYKMNRQTWPYSGGGDFYRVCNIIIEMNRRNCTNFITGANRMSKEINFRKTEFIYIGKTPNMIFEDKYK